MKGQTAVYLSGDERHLVARLRRSPRLDVCQVGDDIWLRGPAGDPVLDERLRLLPGSRRFDVLADGQLIPRGSRVPAGHLPDGPWRPLSSWLDVHSPPARIPASSVSPLGLSLVRDDREREANILIIPTRAWAEYAIAAPQVRLARLRFAISEDGRALVTGQPLPPLAGERWVESSGIAVPAGWHWSPAVDAVVLRQAFRLAEGDLTLFHRDGTCEIIRSEDFVGATRSAVRLSSERQGA